MDKLKYYLAGAMLSMEPGCSMESQLTKQIDTPEGVDPVTEEFREALDLCTSIDSSSNVIDLETKKPSVEGGQFLSERSEDFVTGIVTAGREFSGNPDLSFDEIRRGELPMTLRVSEQIFGQDNCEDESSSCSKRARIQFAFGSDFSESEVFGCETRVARSYENPDGFLPMEVATGFYTDMPESSESTFYSADHYANRDDIWMFTEAFTRPSGKYDIVVIYAMEGGDFRFDAYEYDISNATATIEAFSEDAEVIVRDLLPDPPSADIQTRTILINE